MPYTKQEMLAIGGHEGTRADGTHVVFLPNLRKLLSIDVTIGKNGGIVSATMEGKRIERTKATILLNGIIYWLETDRKIHTNLLPVYLNLINENVAKEIADCA